MKTKIIAEAGSNHNGDINLAFKLVEIAAAAGADYVKFQIIEPASLYVPYYWSNDEKVPNIVYERRVSESLSLEEWREVKIYANKLGIEFTASVFDEKGVDFLVELNVPFVKLASSDLNNLDLIEFISQKEINLIISTGMAELDEIKAAVDSYAIKGDINRLSILHCVSVYPCSLDKTNLSMIDTLNSSFTNVIGFSDHTLDSKAASIAVAKGALFLEKHFTHDNSLDGFDHKYASSEAELKEYIADIRAVENSLMAKPQKLTSDEQVTKIRARRGVYLKNKLLAGSVISEDDLILLRPANSVCISEKSRLLGIKVAEDIQPYQPIKIVDEKVVIDNSNSWTKANDYWTREMKEKKMIGKNES